MKTMLKITLLSLILTCGMVLPASAQSKIATLDLRKLFDGYWKTRQADTALKTSAADLDKEHKGLLESYTKATEDWKKQMSSANDMAVSTEEREKRKKAAEDKLVELKQLEDNIKQFEAQAKENLDTQRRRMRENVLKEIREVISEVAKSDSIDLVLDTAADSINSTPVVIFTNGASDLTEKVLKKLNANAPADLPKTEEKKADAKK